MHSRDEVYDELAVGGFVASPGAPHQEPERDEAHGQLLAPTGGVPEAAGASLGVRDAVDPKWTGQAAGTSKFDGVLPAYSFHEDHGAGSSPELQIQLVAGGAHKMRIAQGAVSAWPNWTTPREFLDVVRQLGVIVLDPFWNEASVTIPKIALGGSAGGGLDDSIPIPWIAAVAARYDTGIIFCNPPYGQFLKRAIPKIVKEGTAELDRFQKDACLEIVSLLPAKTDTAWWHELANHETAGCFWKGRLSFDNPPPGTPGDRPGGANYVSYFGPRPHLFAHIFNPHGIVRVR